MSFLKCGEMGFSLVSLVFQMQMCFAFETKQGCGCFESGQNSSTTEIRHILERFQWNSVFRVHCLKFFERNRGSHTTCLLPSKGNEVPRRGRFNPPIAFPSRLFAFGVGPSRRVWWFRFSALLVGCGPSRWFWSFCVCGGFVSFFSVFGAVCWSTKAEIRKFSL